MAWVVDTCMLIDVLEEDPDFGHLSADTLEAHMADGLVICPVTYVELAPAFEGNPVFQEDFLAEVGVDFRQEWLWEDTLRSQEAWYTFVRRKRSGIVTKRPIADILIGAFASRYGGLLTRNPSHFGPNFPDLPIRTPSRQT